MSLLVTALLMAISVVPMQASQTPTPALDGQWRGSLDTGAGSLRLVLRISKASDGLHTGVLESPDQGATIPIDRIIVNGLSVKLELKSVGGTFEGALSADGAELKGVWMQGTPLPLLLRRDPTTAASPATAAPPGPAVFPLGLPIEMSVPIAPTPFTGNDGKRHLVYEVHASNFGGRDLLVTKFEVLQGAAVVASYEATELNAMILQPGSATATDRRTLGAGRRVVVFLWLPADSATAGPIRHRISIGDVSIEGAAVSPVTNAPIAIGPPLDGADWLAANGPGAASGHRRALIAVEGGARIAQRFAIDFVRLNAGGRTFTGDQKDNKSYRAYGVEALAVADALVAATKDGIPDNVPGLTSRAVPITLETIGGNYVVLDLGGGRYAFYAHFQPGSLRVKMGDRVTRGQVLGLVGNSGNSTEPHLHFHVSNGISPLGSEGLPYAITGMPGMPLLNERVTFKK